MNNNKKFYQKNWFIYLCIFFFPPAGIALLWIYNKKSSTKFKGIISAIAAIWFVILLTSDSSTPTDTNNLVSNEGSLEVESTFSSEGSLVAESTISTESLLVTESATADTEIFFESTNYTQIEQESLTTPESASDSIIGRGHSDSSREEPQYENVSGYVAVYDTHSLEKDDSFVNTPWTVPIYAKDKQFWIEDGYIEHKTEITVVSQQLEHLGYGSYGGYLLVERNDTQEQFYISVRNFITKPYWTYTDLDEAVSVGCFIAEYNQVSDYYPVDKGNKKVELDSKTKVLVIGRTGLYGGDGPDQDTTSIEAIVFKEWKYGYGGVSVYFNKNDLTIVY